MGLNEMIRRGAGSALAEIEKLDEFIERNPRASLRKFKKWAMEERLSLPLFEKVLALSFVGAACSPRGKRNVRPFSVLTARKCELKS